MVPSFVTLLAKVPFSMVPLFVTLLLKVPLEIVPPSLFFTSASKVPPVISTPD